MKKVLGKYAGRVALAAVLAAGLAGAQDEDAWAWEELGAEVYVAQCAACHGPDGGGVEGVFPAMAGNEFVTGDKAPVIELVLRGRGAMPAFHTVLNDEELAAVLSHVRSSWGNEAESVTPDEVAEVREGAEADDEAEAEEVELAEGWFEDGEAIFRANCAACHQAEGQGIPGAFPALAGNAFVMGEPALVIHVVLRGRGGMPSFSGFSDEQVAHVVSYIRTSWESDASLVSPEMVQEVRDSPPDGPTDPLERPGAAN